MTFVVHAHLPANEAKIVNSSCCEEFVLALKVIFQLLAYPISVGVTAYQVDASRSAFIRRKNAREKSICMTSCNWLTRPEWTLTSLLRIQGYNLVHLAYVRRHQTRFSLDRSFVSGLVHDRRILIWMKRGPLYHSERLAFCISVDS